jgi:hypothetical protein
VQHLALPELSFDFSIGEVVIILIVTALILLVITIERTEKTIAKRTKPPATPSTMLMAMKECPARFGFLQKLPRGSTIPIECYICPQLIECLGYQRTPRTRK